METSKFHKVLCANRGEIAIRVFRACNELGMRTVAIFSEEDARHQHRYKADEAYLVGKGRKPVEAYLAIDEILATAKKARVDAIHPGYGFLSESADFADACRAEGIAFIGPRGDAIRKLGDKLRARDVAVGCGVPVIPGLDLDSSDGSALDSAERFFAEHGPLIVKAAKGGGGRGMRMVPAVEQLQEAIESASSEALASFGSPEVFLEKFLPRVRHVEVQIIGDLTGKIVHLFERDCSLQRRHQKVIEVAPAPNLKSAMREALYADALAIASAVGYHNAGTVEFLADGDRQYFIEVNPRLQVEHTVTEMITGIDLVQTQILIEEGHSLSSEEVGIFDQSSIQRRGYAVQCRVTTEDPSNDFLPDTGTIAAYRSAGGFGVRLDTGDGYTGAKVSPYYDSLLVKVTAFANSFPSAAIKGLRALREFRVRGVKTNLAFLENVLQHDHFLRGKTYTRFIDETPELFQLTRSRDRATRLLTYLADVIVNGHPTIKAEDRRRPSQFAEPKLPNLPDSEPASGSVQILAERGAEGLAEWVRDQDRPLLCDTTMRDAHQSLLATRVRTRDMLRIAPAVASMVPELFSVETWGGATFDVAYRFLNEDPWNRLRRLKQAMPNLMQQMLLRGANAVGYTSYPDNVVEKFIDQSAVAGIDVFRVFDSLNDLNNMQVAVKRVIASGKVAEVCICYTGDIDNPGRRKYDLEYFTELSKRIEGMGAHILCIKDMAGLLRPRAAEILVEGLRKASKLPIHLHTHDTSGNGIATLISAIDHGVDIVDVALAPMAGLTSQPSMNALVAALHGGERDSGLTNRRLQPLADYWESVREFYSPFECGLKSSTSEIYYHEIPGGQYSNLRPQVASFGLLDRWNEVKDAFAVVNQIVGDIPKVTPSSKMVGDFAIFIVQNDLLTMGRDLADSVAATRNRILSEAQRLDFPQSVVMYFQGHLGSPPGGFPEDVQKAILKEQAVLDGRPSESLAPLDLEELAKDLEQRRGRPFSEQEALSAALYPRVWEDYLDFYERHGNVSNLPTPVYFYGLEPGQEVWVEIEAGKTLVISLDTVGDADDRGRRTVYFKLNGQPRPLPILDRSLGEEEETGRKADPGDDNQIGAPMPGRVTNLHVAEGEAVAEGDALITLEAMKMETVVRSPVSGRVLELVTNTGAAVSVGDLLLLLEPVT